jgi:hypothetical protein
LHTRKTIRKTTRQSQGKNIILSSNISQEREGGENTIKELIIKEIERIPRIEIKDLYIIIILAKHPINKDFSLCIISLCLL